MPKHMLARALTLAIAGAAMAGCGSDTFKPEPLPNEATLYWDLRLNHHAIALSTASPWDTVRLAATPRNYRGEPLAGLPTPRYISSDIGRVAVGDGGLLQAVEAFPLDRDNLVRVVATMTTGNLKHADTAFVSVAAYDPPPALASFSARPLPPDSSKIGVSQLALGVAVFSDTLYPRARDAADQPIDSLPVYFSGSDTSSVKIDRLTGEFYGIKRGSVTLYASTTAFGVARTDTIPYRIGWPVLTSIDILPVDGDGINGGLSRANVFTLPEVRVGVGATVIWSIFPMQSQENPAMVTDVVFADADLPNVAPMTAGPQIVPFQYYLLLCLIGRGDCTNGGNILLTPVNPSDFNIPFSLGAGRYFPTPGTYEYHSTLQPGSRGRVIVMEDS